jgi:hypothetical protein
MRLVREDLSEVPYRTFDAKADWLQVAVAVT